MWTVVDIPDHPDNILVDWVVFKLTNAQNNVSYHCVGDCVLEQRPYISKNIHYFDTSKMLVMMKDKKTCIKLQGASSYPHGVGDDDVSVQDILEYFLNSIGYTDYSVELLSLESIQN